MRRILLGRAGGPTGSVAVLALVAVLLPGAVVGSAAGSEPGTVTVHADSGRIAGIPDACVPSTVVHRHSYLDLARTTLTCELVDPAAGPPAVTVQPAPDPPTLRLISSPDFTNADLGDLRDGPSSWTPSRSANSTNRAYEHALDTVLGAWAAADPAGVLVAGDLVDGRWGRDQRHTGNFGPVRTPAQQAAAVRRAAATYDPQWLQRFTDHGLDVYPAPGDHEYGDNPWPRSKRALAPVFQSQFARFFTRGRFPDHPNGPHAGTAYAFRPSPDVQVVSLDVFDITRSHARVGLDAPQKTWLKGVLRRARQDGVQWTIVQGHTPVLWPVRTRGSSGLHYPGGAHSDLWRIFEKFGVDLYLCGEVHDTTASDHGGVLQLAHGGLFQYALTTYATLDVHPDRLDVSLDDFAVHVHDAPDHRRLWETVRGGIRKDIHVNPTPFTIGTLSLSSSGEITERSGVLAPYHR